MDKEKFLNTVEFAKLFNQLTDEQQKRMIEIFKTMLAKAKEQQQ